MVNKMVFEDLVKCKRFFSLSTFTSLIRWPKQHRECMDELSGKMDRLEEQVRKEYHRSIVSVNGDDHWFKE
jgi:hypothetical protein